MSDYDELVALRTEREHMFWKESELLYRIMRRGGWKEIAEGKSKRETHSNLGIPTSTVNFKVGLWRTFREKYDIPVELLEQKSANKLSVMIPKLEGVPRKDVLKMVKKL